MGFTKTSCVVRSAVVTVLMSSACLGSVVKAHAEPIAQANKVAQPKEVKKAGNSPAVTSQTASKRSSSAQVSARSVAGVNQITIATGTAAPKYSVTRLQAPERLVVDLEGIKLAHAQSIVPKGLEYVSAVRVGTHPDKTRIVVDLNGKVGIKHEARHDGETITLLVSPQQQATTSAQVTSVKANAAQISAAPIRAAQVSDTQARTGQQPAKDHPERPKASRQSVKNTKLTLDEEVIVSGSSKEAQRAEGAEAVKKSEQVAAIIAPSAPVKKAVDVSGDTLPAGDTNLKATTERARLAPPVLKHGKPEHGKPEIITQGPQNPPIKVAEPSVKVTEPVGKKEIAAASKPATNATKVDPPVSDVKAQDKQAAVQVLEKKQVVHSESLAQPQASSEKPAQQTVAKTEEPKEVVELTTKKGIATLLSMNLEGHGKSSPTIALSFQGEMQHSMDRTAPSEYVLTLRETSAAQPVLQQTLFAPQDSSGIRSVRAVADGSNTLVRIFAQPTSYLTARRVGNVLRIEETQDLAQIARDIRAQISPAAAKENESSKAIPAEAKKNEKTGQDSSKAQNKGKEAQAKQDSFGSEDAGELAAIKGTAQSYTGRLISLDLQDADIDSALRIIAEVSNLNIVAGDGVVGKVTLKLVDVPWDQALEVILKSQGLDKVLEGNVLRVAPVDKLRTEREAFKQARVAEEELEPLSVKYMRVSYAKASEIKGLVETVLSERGSVAFDERSNQLVVKDTRKGLQNVTELIKKIDLRTPQILLETQIIEANRNLSRQLGAELGFQYIQSPATGNGTGLNFPAAIAVGGSADPTNASSITGSAFPVASTASLGSAVTMLFDSADGTKSLALRLSQLEQEGQVRIISKPAVATTNNKAAEIKSVEKYRVKLPNGGLSIASGSGASSSGSGDVATQTIEAGIILNVTPQASPDYYILLDIKAKSSSFGAKSVDGIPNEIERSASSSVLVSSGQTFALGGIYKINEQDRISGVPFFKDIPVLGTLFRNTTTEQADEELLFFITPRIVEGSFEDASAKVIS